MTISHAAAFTVQEIAASVCGPGNELRKTVIVRIDGGVAMAVMPPFRRINFDLLGQGVGACEVEIAAGRVGIADCGPRGHCDNHCYDETPNNLAAADVYFERESAIPEEWERVKRSSMKKRRSQWRKMSVVRHGNITNQKEVANRRNVS